MSKLDEFLAKKESPAETPDYVEWFATVLCQTCGEDVDEQKLYPVDKVLTWKCSQGHGSFMENYTAF